ncbi:MAG TPA: LysM peptidoglycan-binding domain-containing protein [Acidiferrobacteraceae bacterium]|nr:LysM peptidoglycan-binding domain-containing protein [Acidiferrobacteraceae bacterium]
MNKNCSPIAVKHLFLIALTTLVVGCASQGPTQRNQAHSGESEQAAHLQDPTQYEDLWDRVRAGFALEPIDSKTVRRYEKWYADRPDYMENMTRRARRYLYHIVTQVEARGIPTEIALLPAIESAFKPMAYSRARASGLWQFIPSTGRNYGLKQNWWYDGRRDVLAATDAALDYLEKLHKQFNGDWHLALAAYNAGERRIERNLAYNARKGRGTDYQSLRSLKRETRHYVPKLIAVVNIIRDPQAFGLELEPIPNKPYFETVDVGSQIDLGVVADLSGIGIRELHVLNPAFRRWATDPQGPHRILIPVGKKRVVEQGIAALPASKRMQYTRHVVRRGDTVGGIAHRYGLSAGAIRSTNKFRGNLIRAGQNLLIPLSSRALAKAKRAKPRRVVSAKKYRNTRGKVHLVHQVRRGETLYAIAKKYNVYVYQLAQWNKLDVDGILNLGQKIKVIR